MRKVAIFLAALIVATSMTASCTKAEPEKQKEQKKKSLREIDEENMKKLEEKWEWERNHPEYELEQFPLDPTPY